MWEQEQCCISLRRSSRCSPRLFRRHRHPPRRPRCHQQFILVCLPAPIQGILPPSLKGERRKEAWGTLPAAQGARYRNRLAAVLSCPILSYPVLRNDC
jgi:hypothetical protein